MSLVMCVFLAALLCLEVAQNKQTYLITYFKVILVIFALWKTIVLLIGYLQQLISWLEKVGSVIDKSLLLQTATTASAAPNKLQLDVSLN